MTKIVFTFFTLFMALGSVMTQVPSAAEDISPLLISEKVPTIDLYDLDNKPVSSTDLLTGKKTIFLFYRGGWCPYCTSHLSAVGEVEDKIVELGYQIIGISPDAPGNSKKVLEEMKEKYQLYTDKGGALMKAMGIAFEAPERYNDLLSNASDGDNSNLLPVPSIFVLSEDGTILFEYISPDYKQRMEPDLLLAVLESLKK